MLRIGTVVSYTNDGTVNTGFVSEQNEPLGQGISLEPPQLLVRDSGIYDEAAIDKILTAPDSQGNNLARQELGLSVAEYFRRRSINAVTNSDPQFPGVYYNDATYDSQTIIHETLHFITGLNDVELAAALNLRDESRSPIANAFSASLAIRNSIYENCR